MNIFGVRQILARAVSEPLSLLMDLASHGAIFQTTTAGCLPQYLEFSLSGGFLKSYKQDVYNSLGHRRGREIRNKFTRVAFTAMLSGFRDEYFGVQNWSSRLRAVWWKPAF